MASPPHCVSSHPSNPSSPAATQPSASAASDDNDDIDEFFPTNETDDTVTNSEDEDEDEDQLLEEFLDAEEEQDGDITPGDLLDLLTAEEIGGDQGPTGGATRDDDQDDEEIELRIEEPHAGEGAAVQGAAQPQIQTMRISRSQLLRYVRQRRVLEGLFGNVAGHDDDDDDNEDEDGGFPPGMRRRRRRSGLKPSPPPKIPSDVGRELMESGTFGTNERPEGTYRRNIKLGNRIMQRELGLSSPGKQRSTNRLASQALIPSSNADTIVHYDHRCYSGQFSDDGNFFFSCSQDFQVRMYDTSNPYNWTYYKRVSYPYGQWTITDASLSPDNRFLAYSSIRSMVCLAATDPEADSDPHLLEFSEGGRPRLGGWHGGHFGIWSVRFSGDGRELVAGTSDNSVCAYDIETRQTVLHIEGHRDDVNAVCFGDKSSPHLLYSGSDDATVKVWDRRSMSDKRAAGVFLGHTEGLTYIDSKGDGRYVLSNGKDQTMKLWDLRSMVDTAKADTIDSTQYSMPFDYRFEPYDTSKYYRHPNDCSLVTFRGHSVLKTLIRCHFSPPGSSDSRYVYTGSEDGSIYIYNLDATIAAKVNVKKATQNTRPRGQEEGDMMDVEEEGHGTWKTCVRDASWHPNAPIIAATSWNGYGMTEGTCSVHTWNDGLDEDEAEPAMGLRVDARLRPNRHLHEEATAHPRRQRHRLGGGFRRSYHGDDRDD